MGNGQLFPAHDLFRLLERWRYSRVSRRKRITRQRALTPSDTRVTAGRVGKNGCGFESRQGHIRRQTSTRLPTTVVLDEIINAFEEKTSSCPLAI